MACYGLAPRFRVRSAAAFSARFLAANAFALTGFCGETVCFVFINERILFAGPAVINSTPNANNIARQIISA